MVTMARAEARTDGQGSDAITSTAVAAARNNKSVTLAMALTTITVACQGYAPATMAAVTADGHRILDRCAPNFSVTSQTHAPP